MPSNLLAGPPNVALNRFNNCAENHLYCYAVARVVGSSTCVPAAMLPHFETKRHGSAVDCTESTPSTVVARVVAFSFDFKTCNISGFYRAGTCTGRSQLFLMS